MCVLFGATGLVSRVPSVAVGDFDSHGRSEHRRVRNEATAAQGKI